jgi:hypothetical protein
LEPNPHILSLGKFNAKFPEEALPRKSAWTEEENERLKALATSGASVVRAAAALRRSIISVRDHARQLGTPFPSLRIAKQKWTENRLF